jgi:hypothetical protein
MVKSIKSASTLCVFALTLGSCAAPKADVVAPPPVVKKEEKKEPEPAAPEPLPSALPDDGRLNGFLDMPGDAEFRSSNPVTPKVGGGTGPVISRPPLDPPARVKPTAPEPE